MAFSRRTNAPHSPQSHEQQPAQTRYSLACCIVCGHEQVRSRPGRSTCPDCGAVVAIFALYRDAVPSPMPEARPVASMG
jgi:hypothetical protein